MGWFDEQIRERKRSDNADFSEALYDVVGAVEGKEVFYTSSDNRKILKREIDRIFMFYNLKSREIPDSVKDMDEQLEYVLRPCGIMKRTVLLRNKWYKTSAGPLLAKKKDDGAAVALIPKASGGYVFLDEATGKNVRVAEKNAGLFEETALCFYKPFPQIVLTYKELAAHIFGTIPKRDLRLFSVAALAVLLVSTLIPVLYNILFDTVIYQSNLTPLAALSVFLICVSISITMLGVTKKACAGRIKSAMKLSVESAAMMRILSLPASFFKKHSSGSLANKVMLVSNLCEMIVDAGVTAVITALCSLVFVVQIYIYAPPLCGWAVLILALSLLWSVFAARLQTAEKRKELEYTQEEQGIVYALISGIQKIKLAGAEKRAFSKWAKSFSKRAATTYNPPFLLKVSNSAGFAITVLGSVLIYFAAANSKISVADFYAFNGAYGIVSGAFSFLCTCSVTIAGIKPIIENLEPFFAQEPELSEEKQVVSKVGGGIELNGVSFKYGDDLPNVIDNLSLKIRPGQYVAIVGETGCGKSTLLRLMLGFEKPQKGAVYYDGKDLSKLDLKSLRQKTGVVMQDGKLFSGDIFSNITVTSPNLTVEDAWEAAEMAGIAEDIRNMPMGMYTLISEGGGGISGGQRQRILIARAVASKPKILMFDEATSALDNITQKNVSEALDKLKCTRIVIAHRLSTIKQCNRIIVLDKGKIAEDGTYDELMEKNGLFASLAARQKVE